MANWLNELTIHQFRGIKDLTLADLGSVNILVGINNSGKTSILEAIASYARPFDLYEWSNTAWRREVKASRRSTVEALKWLFPQTQSVETEQTVGEIHISSQGQYPVIDVKARFEEIFRLRAIQGQLKLEVNESEESDSEAGARLTVQLQTTLPNFLFQEKVFEIWDTQNRPYPKSSRPSLPVATITPVTHRIEQLSGISDLIKTKNKTAILQALTLFDPGVRDITILSSQGMRSTIEIDHVDFKTTVPVSAFGDGMRRALTFALIIPKIKGGLLLVDEIETAIHVSALQELYSWLVKICQLNDIQLFATTHSLEAVDALLDAHVEPYDGLVTYQLGKAGQPAKRINGELLSRLRYKRGLDVR
jgi:AAA15 family ATPase/GTPase